MEFLSDPWVLVQVMHYPSVLYQWLTAATAEVLRFEQQISEFLFLPYPELWDPIVDQLSSKLDCFALSIDSGFQELQDLIIEHTNPTKIQSTFGLSFDKNSIDIFLSNLITYRSKNCQNVINFFKRLCWNDPSAPYNKSLVKPQLHPVCDFRNYKRHLQKINSASGFTGNLSFSAKEILSCESQACKCEKCLVMYREINKERNDFFKTLSDCKDMDTKKIKMDQFYNDHLKKRFPNVKKELLMAHLVNKKLLYLKWKFEAIEGRIKHFK